MEIETVSAVTSNGEADYENTLTGAAVKWQHRSYTRCYHANIKSSQDAERVLIEKGRIGSFLLRPSKNTPGNFTISVRLPDNSILHIRINNGGDFYQIYGSTLDQLAFASINDLMEYYSNPEHPLTQRNQTIELKYPLNCADTINERWFHGLLSNKDAVELLKDDGDFLVRESNKSPGNFVISLLMDEKPVHLLVEHKPAEGVFNMSGKSYNSMSEIIDMMTESAFYTKDETAIYLRTPIYTSTVLNAAGIANRVQQLISTGVKYGLKTTTEIGFIEEFQALQTMDTRGYNQAIAKADFNRTRNRYKNILPYDHCRVVLRNSDPSTKGSDYINASYITLEDDTCKHQRVIAAQGPLQGTVTDFWRMVWQENSRVIIMVTKEVELGKNKCARYWPEVGETANYDAPNGTFIIRTSDEQNMPDLVVRHFYLSMEGEASPRKITQLFFKVWPDHGTPTDPGVVHNMLYEANQHQLPNAGPMVIHCSAGIGRTGTVIMIDLLSNKIRQLGLECEIDIQKTLCILRSQRPGMVQTVDQYRYIYLAMANYVDMIKVRLEEEQKSREEDGNEYANVMCRGGVINVINETPAAAPAAPIAPQRKK
ncbi:tyrosine-protein phosphatase non-receptor type 11-like isoform X2 [Tubulanus polymorphus]|uniref:tyrosine-protein phosphatase non-receptor type 11-like isoform X2 n=1 Tax=Tubulanus polymorphus TaxID=672921 RepID=UPI003DA33D7C